METVMPTSLFIRRRISWAARSVKRRRTGALAKAFQARFREKFGEVRCRPLLKADIHADDNTPVARDMGLTNRCDVMIITAMEIVEEIRAQQA